MVDCHFEDGQLVQSPWDCIACWDHLCELRHVPVHPLTTSLLYFTMLGSPVNNGGRKGGREGGRKGGREGGRGGGRRKEGEEEECNHFTR